MAIDKAESYDDLWDIQMKQAGRCVAIIEQFYQGKVSGGVDITSINIQGPNQLGAGYRAIIKGRDENGAPFVSFRVGDTLVELHSAISKGLLDGSLRWKPDVPWTEAQAALKAAQQKARAAARASSPRSSVRSHMAGCQGAPTSP